MEKTKWNSGNSGMCDIEIFRIVKDFQRRIEIQKDICIYLQLLINKLNTSLSPDLLIQSDSST